MNNNSGRRITPYNQINTYYNEEKIFQKYLKKIIAEIYPNKEDFEVKELVNILRLIRKKGIMEIKGYEDENSLEMLIKFYESELQNISLSDICTTISSFIPEESKNFFMDNFNNTHHNISKNNEKNNEKHNIGVDKVNKCNNEKFNNNEIKNIKIKINKDNKSNKEIINKNSIDNKKIVINKININNNNIKDNENVNTSNYSSENNKNKKPNLANNKINKKNIIIKICGRNNFENNNNKKQFMKNNIANINDNNIFNLKIIDIKNLNTKLKTIWIIRNYKYRKKNYNCY